MIDKDLALDLMQNEIYRLREENALLLAEKVANYKPADESLERDLAQKTMEGSVFPPKFTPKGEKS